jgi:hypothetical protein
MLILNTLILSFPLLCLAIQVASTSFMHQGKPLDATVAPITDSLLGISAVLLDQFPIVQEDATASHRIADCAPPPKGTNTPDLLLLSANLFLEISQELLSSFQLISEYAKAAYCKENWSKSSINAKVSCDPGQCPLLEQCDTEVLLKFS